MTTDNKGRPPSGQPNKRTLQLRLDPASWEMLGTLAYHDGDTPSGLARRYIDQGILRRARAIGDEGMIDAQRARKMREARLAAHLRRVEAMRRPEPAKPRRSRRRDIELDELPAPDEAAAAALSAEGGSA